MHKSNMTYDNQLRKIRGSSEESSDIYKAQPWDSTLNIRKRGKTTNAKQKIQSKAQTQASTSAIHSAPTGNTQKSQALSIQGRNTTSGNASKKAQDKSGHITTNYVASTTNNVPSIHEPNPEKHVIGAKPVRNKSSSVVKVPTKPPVLSKALTAVCQKETKNQALGPRRLVEEHRAKLNEKEKKSSGAIKITGAGSKNPLPVSKTATAVSQNHKTSTSVCQIPESKMPTRPVTTIPASEVAALLKNQYTVSKLSNGSITCIPKQYPVPSATSTIVRNASAIAIPISKAALSKIQDGVTIYTQKQSSTPNGVSTVVRCAPYKVSENQNTAVKTPRLVVVSKSPAVVANPTVLSSISPSTL